MVRKRSAVSHPPRDSARQKTHAPAVVVSPPPGEPATPPVLKKVVLVDGPNIGHPDVRRALNTMYYRYGVFYNILTKEVGEGEMAEPPVWTVQLSLPEYVMKQIEVGGFKVEPLDTAFEADDRFLIQKIKGLDPSEIGTLVLVTCDGSFAGAAREAKSRGIKVHWVLASDVFDQRGKPFVGRETKQLVETEFTLVDLHQLANRIRNREWEERSQRSQMEEKKSVVAFRAEVPNKDLADLMAGLKLVIDRFRVHVSFES